MTLSPSGVALAARDGQSVVSVHGVEQRDRRSAVFAVDPSHGVVAVDSCCGVDSRCSIAIRSLDAVLSVHPPDSVFSVHPPNSVLPVHPPDSILSVHPHFHRYTYPRTNGSGKRSDQRGEARRPAETEEVPHDVPASTPLHLQLLLLLPTRIGKQRPSRPDARSQPRSRCHAPTGAEQPHRAQ